MKTFLSMIHFGDKIYVNDINGYHKTIRRQKDFKWYPIDNEEDIERENDIEVFRNFDGIETKFIRAYEQYDNPTKFRKSNHYIHKLPIINPEMVIKSEELWDEKPNILYFDLEVETRGDNRFPSAERNPIVMIGYQINDEEPVVLDCIEEYRKYVTDNHITPDDDIPIEREIIKQFGNLIIEEDFDIIVGFNSNIFDLPYYLERMNRYGFDTTLFAKIGADKMFKYSNAIKGHKGMIYKTVPSKYRTETACFMMPGRILYDIYMHSIISDTALTGIKDHKMKTIAKEYELDDVVEMETYDMTNLCNVLMDETKTEKFVQYLHSDIRITKALGDMYLSREMAIAEVSNLPLNVTLERGRGTIATIGCIKAFHDENIKDVATNLERHSFLFDGGDTSNKKKYQGATVAIYHKGKFNQISKIDFGSMYPSSQINFNLSPESTRIAKDDNGERLILPYKEKDTTFTWNEDRLYIDLSDAKLRHNYVVEVDFSKPSVLKRTLLNGLENRSKYKQLMKENIGTPLGTLYESYSNAFKVFNNSVYGLQGNLYTTHTSVVVAFTITAICRYLTKRVIEYIGYENTVEVDTDGIYVSKPIDVDEINLFLDSIMIDEIGLDENYMKMDLDVYGKGYFYAEKNYVLEKVDKDGNPKIDKDGSPLLDIKGSTLKGRKIPECVSKAIRIMIDCVLYDKYTFDEAVKIASDIHNAPLDSFTFSIRFRDKNSYHANIASSRDKLEVINLIEKYTGNEVRAGEMIEVYYSRKSRYGLEPSFMIDKNRINYKKYKEDIDTRIKLFSVDKPNELSISDLFGNLRKRERVKR